MRGLLDDGGFCVRPGDIWLCIVRKDGTETDRREFLNQSEAVAWSWKQYARDVEIRKVEGWR